MVNFFWCFFKSACTKLTYTQILAWLYFCGEDVWRNDYV